jgi:antirestriction protein
MEEQQSEIRIYVSCLAAYNNGILHGVWIDANQDEDAIRYAIHDMLKVSPIECAEEYAIHDYEGFCGISISEYEGITEVVEYAEFIAEHGELGGSLYSHYGDIESAQKAITDHYHGSYKSLTDFAEELTAETTQIPDSIRFYIDYEAMARDLEINDVVAIETGFEQVHVFWNH